MGFQQCNSCEMPGEPSRPLLDQQHTGSCIHCKCARKNQTNQIPNEIGHIFSSYSELFQMWANQISQLSSQNQFSWVLHHLINPCYHCILVAEQLTQSEHYFIRQQNFKHMKHKQSNTELHKIKGKNSIEKKLLIQSLGKLLIMRRKVILESK